MSDRQDRLPGFSTDALQSAGVLLIGAGGLMGGVATGLVRKGIGRLRICDHDLVEVHNLNRQEFYAEDLFKPKALRLARNAARGGFLDTAVEGHHVPFDKESVGVLSDGIDVAVCGVDNNRTRAYASRFFREKHIPLIQTAVSETADYGWVLMEDTNGPCVGCIFPAAENATAEKKECRPSPAVLDILRCLSGFVLYGVDTLLMGRTRHWNFRTVHLAGGGPDLVTTSAVRAGCRLCGGSR